jgi:hypothetical protein
MKIVSGGQTGADRAALEVAQEFGLETGGYAPKGYLTEDGPDLTLRQFGLREHVLPEYPPRTRMNIRFSDGTAVFGHTTSLGTRYTIRMCIQLGKPYICNPTAKELSAFIAEHDIKTLNVAGNRASKNAGVTGQVKDVLTETFRRRGL